MSLYYLQKLMYELNRDPGVRERFESDMESVLTDYRLSEEELTAVRKPDIGHLFVMGVNGQLLMHYAALCQYEWDDYINAMREGEKTYGPVKDGLYTRAEGRE